MTSIIDSQIARLQQDINELIVVEDAAIVLIENLALQIRANMNDPVALDALASELEAQKDRLAAAVAANTPGETAPAEEAPVEEAPAEEAPAEEATPEEPASE